MSAEEFIKDCFSSQFASIQEAKGFYKNAKEKFSKFDKKDQEKIVNSMCLEMFERIEDYNK